VQETDHSVTLLRHSIFLNLRAAILGGALGYGYWYVAHHAGQFGTVVTIMLLVVVGGTAWTSKLTFGKLYRLNYLVLPLVLFAGSLFFFLLLKNPTYQLLFSLGIGITYWYFFRSFAELREHPSPERKKSFTQALDVVSNVTVFLTIASVHELYFFFSWKPYWLVLSVAAFSAVLLYQSYWYHRIVTARTWLYVVLGSLLMAQLAWVLLMLPTGYLTNTLLCVAGLYVFGALSIAQLRGIIHRRLILEHVSVAGIICVIGILSSRWTPLA
jgi:hypothetical protein